MKVTRKNYLTIQGWMVTELKLSGNELLLYALIFGFTQDNETEYSGNINYMMKWLNCSKRTIIRCIEQLCEKEYLRKIDQPGKESRYTTFTTGDNLAPLTGDNIAPHQEQNGTTTGDNLTPPTIYIYNNKNILNTNFSENKEVNEAFREYLLHRIKLKCTNTQRVVDRLLAKLHEYAKNSDQAVEIVNKAITCNWKDFYPLKDENGQIKTSYKSNAHKFEGYSGVPNKD